MTCNTGHRGRRHCRRRRAMTGQSDAHRRLSCIPCRLAGEWLPSGRRCPLTASIPARPRLRGDGQPSGAWRRPRFVVGLRPSTGRASAWTSGWSSASRPGLSFCSSSSATLSIGIGAAAAAPTAAHIDWTWRWRLLAAARAVATTDSSCCRLSRRRRHRWAYSRHLAAATAPRCQRWVKPGRLNCRPRNGTSERLSNLHPAHRVPLPFFICWSLCYCIGFVSLTSGGNSDLTVHIGFVIVINRLNSDKSILSRYL